MINRTVFHFRTYRMTIRASFIFIDLMIYDLPAAFPLLLLLCPCPCNSSLVPCPCNDALVNKVYPIIYINFYPSTEDIRNDPRYDELLRKMNLPTRKGLITSNQ